VESVDSPDVAVTNGNLNEETIDFIPGVTWNVTVGDTDSSDNGIVSTDSPDPFLITTNTDTDVLVIRVNKFPTVTRRSAVGNVFSVIHSASSGDSPRLTVETAGDVLHDSVNITPA
jgi:hypothetical protein